jgi:transcription elongation factor B subunit 1
MADKTQGLSKYVTLVSCDGFEFVVLREAACKSGAIKRLDPKSESIAFESLSHRLSRDGLDGMLMIMRLR